MKCRKTNYKSKLVLLDKNRPFTSQGCYHSKTNEEKYEKIFACGFRFFRKKNAYFPRRGLCTTDILLTDCTSSHFLVSSFLVGFQYRRTPKNTRFLVEWVSFWPLQVWAGGYIKNALASLGGAAYFWPL